MGLGVVDIAIFIGYFLLILLVAYRVSSKGKGEQTSKEYFFAGGTLSWWVIGASVIASNISAEQFIGMSGSGYAIGIGIATYEWIGAIGLLVVAKYFLPIYIKNGIYTMPEFLEKRYDKRLRISLALFWILVYWFVNLTSVLYLGALVLDLVLGIGMWPSVIALATISSLYAVFGGLKAVAYTDVLQVIFLVVGGLFTSYYALDALGVGGVLDSVSHLIDSVPERFDLILEPDNPNYKYLPGAGVLFGGLWVANIAYFGCNQYIIQRSLAAKSISEAQKGMAFAAFLKLFIPVLVVLPGVVAYALNADIAKADDAYPWILNSFVPVGIKGLSFAALIAAVVSSLSSMVNSASTIFTLDIYKSIIDRDAEDRKLVRVGKLVSGLSLVVAVLIAPSLGSLDQAFQFIQDFTGMVSPGIVVIFLMGLFWKKTTTRAALWVAILTIPTSVVMDLLFDTLPFIDRMGIAALLLTAIAAAISILKPEPSSYSYKRTEETFKTDSSFAVISVGILLILGTIYYLFW